MNAIPTYYQGIRFRSRLEAKWAAFFDQIGWSWTYEPLDLGGYIPDFVLRFPAQRILVEVKPGFTAQELEEMAGPKIAATIKQHDMEALAVGPQMPLDFDSLGILFERENTGWGHGWGMAQMMRCPPRKGIERHVGFQHMEGYHGCRYCGAYTEDEAAEFGINLSDEWARAHNLTRWEPR